MLTASSPAEQEPDAGVMAWPGGLEDEVAITAISVGELLVGVPRLPDGARRRSLAAAVDSVIVGFSDAVLPYDAEAGRGRRSLGRPWRGVGRRGGAVDSSGFGGQLGWASKQLWWS